MSELTVVNNSLTVADLRDHAYFLADEEPGAAFRETDVVRLLNMGFRRVFAASEYPWRIAKSYTPPGVREYPLINAAPSGSGENAEVEWVDLLDANEGFIASLSAVSTYDHADTETGQPTEYAVSGNSIWLSPAPDTDYNIRVKYRSETYTLTLSDTPPVSDEQAEAVVYYAVWQMKLKDDEPAIADRWKAEFDRQLKKLTELKPGVYKAKQ